MLDVKGMMHYGLVAEEVPAVYPRQSPGRTLLLGWSPFVDPEAEVAWPPGVMDLSASRSAAACTVPGSLAVGCHRPGPR